MGAMKVYESCGLLHQKSYLHYFLRGGGRKEDEDQENGEGERAGDSKGNRREKTYIGLSVQRSSEPAMKGKFQRRH